MDENNDEIISKKARLNIVSNDYNILGENDEQIKENYELETTERLAKISKIFNKLTAKEKVIFNKMKNGDYSDKNGGYLMKKMQKLLGVKNE
jgi:fructose-specific phosphotransferase system component IIB